ncbi:MAG: transglycosylase domain-containing protein, partial [Pseudooceanicola atlanticus]
MRWLLILVLALWAGALGRDRLDAWVAATEIPPLLLDTSAEVRDRDGALLRVYTVADGRWRLGLSPEDVDPAYIRMLLAFEDKRFHRHAGVDPVAMLRAAWQSARAGQIVSGGSTLTMQVARLLEGSGTGAWAGKLRQIRLALALERQISKHEILRLYLTLAPMGGNLEGIRAATLGYFGKEPRRLTPAEAALLVALPQSPEARRPDRDPLAAIRARDRVLDRMAGYGVLPEDEVAAAKTDTAPRARRPFPALAPHMTDRALAEAPDVPVQSLTLDATLQASLESLARTTLRGRSDRLSIAMMVANHRSGEVLASVGSAGLGDAT